MLTSSWHVVTFSDQRDKISSETRTGGAALNVTRDSEPVCFGPLKRAPALVPGALPHVERAINFSAAAEKLSTSRNNLVREWGSRDRGIS